MNEKPVDWRHVPTVETQEIFGAWERVTCSRMRHGWKDQHVRALLENGQTALQTNLLWILRQTTHIAMHISMSVSATSSAFLFKDLNLRIDIFIDRIKLFIVLILFDTMLFGKPPFSAENQQLYFIIKKLERTLFPIVVRYNSPEGKA